MTQSLDHFITAVRRNCDISDSLSVGLYSICGLALRLRDLYKWEHDLKPWVEKNSAQISGWIDQKENLWETLNQEDFKPLQLFGKTYDPFDTKGINQALSPHRLFYGAGYAHALKPTFFVCEIEEKQQIKDRQVIILNKELARDLLTLPALHQDHSIIVRKHAARIFLWDQMMYLKKSGRTALDYALKKCGLPDSKPETRKNHLETILSVQAKTYIYHEIGELSEDVFHTATWRKMISQFPQTPVELLARTVKDLLADTHPSGTLRHIIETRSLPGIGFYAAFIDGMAKVLFPELRLAFHKFIPGEGWELIESARVSGFTRACRYARDMMDIFLAGQKKNNMEWVQAQIHEKMIQPHLT